MTANTDFSKNNLDFLRLLLAVIVFLFHLHALTNLDAFAAFNTYLSPHFAVRSFFVISGMLIYRSYMRSSSFSSYFEKRVRRIYPAYFVVILISAISLCTLSTLPLSKYFGLGFCKYLGANLMFLNFLAPSLPGVFTSNVLPAVNGALWTLKIEVAFYLTVPLIHYCSARFGTRKILGILFFFSLAWKYGFLYLASLVGTPGLPVGETPRNFYEQMDVQFPAELVYFCAGILLLIYFDTLKRYFRIILALTGAAYLADYWLGSENLDIIWISGVVFVFGFWRYFGNFSKYGDFSYGVYIVHWPILQTMIVFRLTALNPYVFLGLSLFFVGLGSVLLWNCVETQFLTKSSHYREQALRAISR